MMQARFGRLVVLHERRGGDSGWEEGRDADRVTCIWIQ